MTAADQKVTGGGDGRATGQKEGPWLAWQVTVRGAGERGRPARLRKWLRGEQSGVGKPPRTNPGDPDRRDSIPSGFKGSCLLRRHDPLKPEVTTSSLSGKCHFACRPNPRPLIERCRKSAANKAVTGPREIWNRLGARWIGGQEMQHTGLTAQDRKTIC